MAILKPTGNRGTGNCPGRHLRRPAKGDRKSSGRHLGGRQLIRCPKSCVFPKDIRARIKIAYARSWAVHGEKKLLICPGKPYFLKLIGQGRNFPE